MQVSVDPGHAFDLDHEIDGLRGQLGRLKEVRPAPRTIRGFRFGAFYCRPAPRHWLLVLGRLEAGCPSRCRVQGFRLAET